MRLTPIMPMVLTSFVVGAPMASAEVLNTHRIPAVLAVEAASESIGVCAKQGYLETAVVTIALEAGEVRSRHCPSSRMSCFLAAELSLSLAMKPLVQLARAALQEPSWMTLARALDWRKFEIG